MRIQHVALLLLLGSTSHAIEIANDLSIGPSFLYDTTDVDAELVDGQLLLGGGYTAVSDFRDVRFGGQARVGWSRAWFTAVVEGSWGPSQRARGWATLAPKVSGHFELRRVTLDGELETTLRRTDAALGRWIRSIDQLQLRAELDATIDQHWELGVTGYRSFYDPDLARPSLRRADLGFAVTLAGRPERWAISGRARRAFRKWAVESGVAGVWYADGRGAAIVPRVMIRAGPFRRFTVETSGEVAIGLA
ncbi:MAG TPA: hypothetical protein VJ891_17185, partial [Casimicrobiaceae bacterium]|nr:hypothetical protein [Casimicrobiaceae bacterium]